MAAPRPDDAGKELLLHFATASLERVMTKKALESWVRCYLFALIHHRSFLSILSFPTSPSSVTSDFTGLTQQQQRSLVGPFGQLATNVVALWERKGMPLLLEDPKAQLGTDDGILSVSIAGEEPIAIHGMTDPKGSTTSCWIALGVKCDSAQFLSVASTIAPLLHAALMRSSSALATANRFPPSLDADGSLTKELTPAQSRIVVLLQKGLTTIEIADALARSRWTIKTQIAELHRKYNVRNRTELLQTISKT